MDIKKYIASGVLEQYVLGLTSKEESETIDRYAEKYPEVKEKIRRLQSCMEHYASLHAIDPPNKNKNKTLSKIDDIDECKAMSIEYKRSQVETSSPSPSFMERYGAAITGLAAMMTLTLGVLSYLMFQNQNEANAKIASLSGKIETLQTDYENLKNQNQQLIAQYEVLKDISTQQIRLSGSDMAPQALAVVYYNPDQKNAFLNIVNLPQPPDGHQYQLWADVDGKHINMGMLAKESDPAELHTVEYMDNSKGFAITLEKDGGSAKPTVAKVCLKGDMKNI